MFSVVQFRSIIINTYSQISMDKIFIGLDPVRVFHGDCTDDLVEELVLALELLNK